MIAWFVRNPIAANLIMVLVLVGGSFSIPAVDKQFFPEFEVNIVQVRMPYLGAGPSEVEEQVCVRIEEAVHDLNGIKEIRSIAREGSGTVLIEAEADYDMQRLTAEVKTRVDSISTFPAEVERPIISELSHRHRMITVAIAGDIGEENLKILGENLRDEMSALPDVSVVELDSPRAYEVSVEVSENTLRRYGLRFDDVVNAIRNSSLNLPAGSIKAETGDIRLQTRGQAYVHKDFESIVLLSKRDGTRVLLGDVATIIDGFADEDVRRRFNGKPAYALHAYVTSRPNVLRTSETVREWAAAAAMRLPEGVELTVWRDQANPFKSRVETLVKNGLGGLVLVFLVLVLFLRPLLAAWVCVGIAVAFMGTLFLLPYLGVGLNMLSLFAFLLILGIVVDDAIIVGESIHTRQSAGQLGDSGAIAGAHAVVKPVMFAVISTMIFFVPMWLLPGELAHAARDIPTVVIVALVFSLVECMLILPAHLAYMRAVRPHRIPVLTKLERLREGCAAALVRCAATVYRPFLDRCLHNSQLTISLFLVVLIISLAIPGGGWMRIGFFPSIIDDDVEARLELREGAAFQQVLARLDQIEQAALALRESVNAETGNNSIGPVSASVRDNIVQVRLELDDMRLNSEDIAGRWREAIGDLGTVESFRIAFTIRDDDKPIMLVLASRSLEDLEAVSDELRQVLLSYPGVFNVNDTLQAPREEIELNLKPAAENLDITLAELARQVRRAFYGAEAQRIPRAREDVKVMVRYPENERLSVDNLNEMRIRTPGEGREVPFEAVADVNFKPGYQTIDRLDRKRILEVSAEVVAGTSTPREVINEITRKHLPGWRARYPGLSMALDGELKEERAYTVAMLSYLLLSMLVIYGLMAIAFRSYWQPVLILTAIPFGIMGAIFGHLVLGWQISMFSLMGVMACAGVVVNDNLVLIDRINQLRAGGRSVRESLLQGGQDRFRPIILTSITTFIGLLPIMSETSVQAQFLIPMTISLAFGVLLATGVTLILVPALYLVGEQFRERFLSGGPALVGNSPGG